MLIGSSHKHNVTARQAMKSGLNVSDSVLICVTDVWPPVGVMDGSGEIPRLTVRVLGYQLRRHGDGIHTFKWLKQLSLTVGAPETGTRRSLTGTGRHSMTSSFFLGGMVAIILGNDRLRIFVFCNKVST